MQLGQIARLSRDDVWWSRLALSNGCGVRWRVAASRRQVYIRSAGKRFGRSTRGLSAMWSSRRLRRPRDICASTPQRARCGHFALLRHKECARRCASNTRCLPVRGPYGRGKRSICRRGAHSELFVALVARSATHRPEQVPRIEPRRAKWCPGRREARRGRPADVRRRGHRLAFRRHCRHLRQGEEAVGFAAHRRRIGQVQRLAAKQLPHSQMLMSLGIHPLCLFRRPDRPLAASRNRARARRR